MSGKLCVSPMGANFKDTVNVKVKGTLFRMVPETLTGKLGDAKVCGAMGTALTT